MIAVVVGEYLGAARGVGYLDFAGGGYVRYHRRVRRDGGVERGGAAGGLGRRTVGAMAAAVEIVKPCGAVDCGVPACGVWRAKLAEAKCAWRCSRRRPTTIPATSRNGSAIFTMRDWMLRFRRSRARRKYWRRSSGVVPMSAAVCMSRRFRWRRSIATWSRFVSLLRVAELRVGGASGRSQVGRGFEGQDRGRIVGGIAVAGVFESLVESRRRSRGLRQRDHHRHGRDRGGGRRAWPSAGGDIVRQRDHGAAGSAAGCCDSCRHANAGGLAGGVRCRRLPRIVLTGA